MLSGQIKEADMAKKDVEKRFHWIKVEERVWQDRRIKRLLKLDPAYLIMYMRLATMTANSAGIFTYEGLDDDIEAEIALAIDADEDDVREAVRWYVKLGLAEISEDRTVLAVSSYDVGIYAGQSSAQALNKAAQREKVKRGQQNAGSGQDEDKAGTDAGQNEDKSGTKVGQVEDKTRTKVGQNEDKKADICTLRDRERERGRVRAESTEKPGFSDDDLPFKEEAPADSKGLSDIDSRIQQVMNTWNQMSVSLRENEGIKIPTIRSLPCESDRYTALYNILNKGDKDKTLQQVLACIKAVPQVDVWVRPSEERYSGWVIKFAWFLAEYYSKVLPRMERMGVIKPVMADGGITYEVDNVAASREPKKPAEEPKEKPLLSLCPKGYTGPRVIVNGIERPA